jgi:hypothetical protein
VLRDGERVRVPLVMMDGVARQLSNFFDGATNIPRIAQHMRLPAFRYAALDPYTWPAARK